LARLSASHALVFSLRIVWSKLSHDVKECRHVGRGAGGVRACIMGAAVPKDTKDTVKRATIVSFVSLATKNSARGICAETETCRALHVSKNNGTL
jgi:adenosine/AMP kinase